MKNLDEIIKGCQSNNRHSREELFNRYSKILFGVCRRYISDPYLAEDVLQEVFIKIFLSINQFNNKGSFEGWIKRIAANAALQYLKDNQKIRFTDIEQANLPEKEDEPKIDDEITSEEIMEMIHELPEGYRIVLNLFLFEEFSHQKIASKLGIKEGTSRSQYAKARKMLIGLITKKKQMVSND